MQLQVNTAGAWKTVMTFGHGEETMERVKQAAQALHEVSQDTAWRITTTTGRSPVVLRHMGRNTYGIWIDRTEP
ncbi:MAG: hypothetical protein ACTS5V_00330 [Giesbergeria sp.]